MLCDVEIILTIFKWGGTQKYSNDANPSPLTTRICLVTFLAAMSSSRSDVVTQFVRSSVLPYPFFSFSVPEVFSSPKEFPLCFKKV